MAVVTPASMAAVAIEMVATAIATAAVAVLAIEAAKKVVANECGRGTRVGGNNDSGNAEAV